MPQDVLTDAPASEGALSDLITFRLVRLAETISRGSSMAYKARFGINNTELRVLVMLARGEALTVSQLGRRMHIDKGWVSRSVEALRRRGIVMRQPHATDSRAGLVALTQAGHDLVAALAPVARERHRVLLDGLDQAGVGQLVSELERRVEVLLSLS